MLKTSRETRIQTDLSGYWRGTLRLNPAIDVAAPEEVVRDFYVPLAWNMQIGDLLWPGPARELSAITRPVQNQNFRDIERKFSEGVIVYRRAVALPKLENGYRAFWVFEGSHYRTSAEVNGQPVGENRNGHLAFEFEITDALRDGENELVVTVDNLRDRDGCPQEQFNWKNYGGIYRPCYIEYRPGTHVASYQVLPGQVDNTWFAEVRVALNRAVSGLPVRVTISSGAEVQHATWTTDAEGCASGRLTFTAPVVWRPGAGGLSDIEIALEHDGATSDVRRGRFGFRTVAVEGRAIRINGEPFRILGASWHEQHPAFGNSVPGWQWRKDLKLLKHGGLNAVRAAHYPYSQGFYDACDEEGVVCIAEMPCWQFNDYHFASAQVRAHCAAYAEELVRQLHHHPSIIGWCVQNESKTFAPGAVDFFSALNAVFKQNDPSRFTLTAESPSPPEHLAVVKTVKGKPSGDVPPTAQVMDVLGLNNYAAWYGEKSSYLPLLLDHAAERCTDRPILVTEFGAEATPGCRNLALPHYSEDYQAELLCRQIKEILRRDEVAGFFIWLFCDYEASSISISGINAKGLVDGNRNPKLAYHLIRQQFADTCGSSP